MHPNENNINQKPYTCEIADVVVKNQVKRNNEDAYHRGLVHIQ